MVSYTNANYILIVRAFINSFVLLKSYERIWFCQENFNEITHSVLKLTQSASTSSKSARETPEKMCEISFMLTIKTSVSNKEQRSYMVFFWYKLKF